jgi:hypothetical protein
MLRAAVIGCLLLVTGSLCADDHLSFLAHLRRLQLFDLAEHYCRQELANDDLPNEEQAQLTVELIRTLALHAIHQPPAEREALWNEARSTARQFEQKHPNHPQIELIEVQDALTLLARGELLRQEAEAVGADHATLQSAAEHLHAAARALEELRAGLEKTIPERRSQTPHGGALSAQELERLQMNVGLHLAKARRQQALCYDTASRDRKALLLATVDTIEQAVAKLPAEDELAGEMRVLQITCLRELGRFDEAQRLWPLIDTDDQPPAVRRAGLAEAARLLIAADLPQDALTLLDEPRFVPLATGDAPELQLARLEAMLAASQQAAEAKKSEEQARWQRAAAALAQQIDQQHGRAWGRRADQLVTSRLPSDGAAGNVDLLARVADNLYVKQQIDEALAAYDKGASAARAAGDADREFKLRYKAALVEQQRSRFATAAGRFERLAIDLKNHPQAAEAHLLACWNKAQQVRTDSTAGAAYANLLDDHLARFPSAATTDQARFWLGRWRQTQRDWPGAWAAYSALSTSAKELSAAIPLAAQCARHMHSAEAAGDASTTPAPPPQAVAQFFTQIAQADDAAAEARQAAALVAAQWLLEQGGTGPPQATSLLSEALSQWAEAPEAWRNEASALLVAALASQPERRAEAEQQLERVGRDPTQLLSLLDRLAAVSQQLHREQRDELAALQLKVIDRITPSSAKLSPSQQQQLALLHAETLAAAGEREQALAKFAPLVEAHPNRGDVQETYAALLAAGTDRPSREAALVKWRQVAAKSKPRSERWWRAKYAVASLQKELGDAAAAATLCRYLLETPPGIADAQWKARFTALLQACGR